MEKNPSHCCKGNYVSNLSRINPCCELSMHGNTGLTWLVLYNNNVLAVCYCRVRNISNSSETSLSKSLFLN